MGSNNRKRGKALLAGLVAAATLLGPTTSAFAADGGGGSGSGTGTGDGHAGGTGQITWVYKDSYGAPTRENVKAAMSSAGVKSLDGTESNGAIDDAVTSANSECVARAKASGNQNPTCRLVSVGFVHTPGSSGDWYTGANGGFTTAQWAAAYKASGISGTTYYYQGAAYKTTDAFSDGTTTIDKLASREMNKAPRAVIAIVLDQDEPPVDYDLTVTTNQQAGKLEAGSTGPVKDVVHANRSGSAISENLTATAILHYDGHPDGYVESKTVSKTFTMANDGDTTTPEFTPADFGLTHWGHGNWWFDVQVARQGRMKAAVDTADREASETFTVPDEPPAKPSKTIDKGTSASRMVNRTVITSGTGKGGWEMTFKDTITPNGVDYEVSNYRLLDKTDNRDVSGEFTIGWDRQANTVTAVRAADKGEMPLDHEYEFSFDVTVNKPDFSKVHDEATVTWNKTEQSTDGHEFPTWSPNPDKSWIVKGSDGKWAAVVDPERTNATGADTMTFLDHSEVASVVNGTIASDLVQAPDKVELKDDWTKADYLFDATSDKSGIRVYETDIATERQTSANDIANTGKDVTDLFDITLTGTSATATAKPAYLKTLKGLKSAKQITLLIPGETNFANGGGAGQVRKDYGKGAGDELTFCNDPDAGTKLTNSGSETVNDHTVDTNEPYICGYVPPVEKDVVGEASQGGDQDSVQGKVVFPGQKVEYQLTTQPKLPENLAYDVKNVTVTDTFDQYLVPDKQTLEVRDLATGKTISKKQYATKWSDEDHSFRLVFRDAYVKANWGKGRNPSVLIRFEGTVSEDSPTDHRIANKWGLTLNNSVTPSNEVYNIPPALTPSKKDNQSEEQGDATVSIDGKTLLLGDTGNYILTLDAKDLAKESTAYKVQRLGLVDDYDEEYLDIDQTKIEVLDSNGKDVTKKFNIQIKDGVAYVFAKTVDTEIPATGETVKGDPQPADLEEYSTRKLDATKDPSIDQDLLGQAYSVVMPYTVIKVTDGYTVKNKAIQITNDLSKETNEVSNSLKPINPAKDVTVKVGGESIDGKSVYLNRTFLYQLDSSIIPANRAYPQVDQWKIVDPLNTEYDRYTGQWAVYATRDLYAGGQVVAAKGDRIAGNGFDSSKFGGDLFTAAADENGQVTVEATELYRSLVGADNEHEHGWRAYIQCTRTKVSDRVENRFTEYYNDKTLESNVVWTRTPDMTPSIHIEKYDVESGEQAGDRDDVKDALKMDGDSQEIAFKITNTSKTDSSTGKGAWYLAKDLKMVDKTIAGEGEVVDLKYPDNWDTLVLKPGESTIVTGTLKGVRQGGRHTDRVKVTGTPLVECPVTDTDPFGGKNDETRPSNAVDVKDGDKTVTLCSDTKVESNTDDWSGYRPSLARTGAAIGGMLLAVIAVGALGTGLLLARRKAAGTGTHGAHSGK
ncbi:LPXTG cell wall anchor domain-containing protein [Bifidobacterium dentium]|uniref:LPXTG cell wall anchor domain-containing protein n=1 Tax=Bifidobacterium dentium TaxID=1689 RepID=UPI001F51027A|nr:LPXTG cell wall anchor domain-containing protein [Bifidobacterium dentium]